MQIDQWVQNIQQGQTTALAKAITLVESQKDSDWQMAKQLLASLPKSTKQTRRIGFSGPPGVGKSTLIEKIGMHAVGRGEKVAVLAVDPSSVVSGGSILGDKTRMELLTRQELAFVRPSPTRGHLGGVTSRLPGAILLCEAAGYDWILIESVGVGQSEVELSRMVDLFTLISQPGAGDELQGIKKGILEYVDMILVNKADRDPQLVNTTQQQLLAAIKIMRTQEISVLASSGLSGQGVDEFFQKVDLFYKSFDSQRRSSFQAHWFESLVFSEFRNRVANHPGLQKSFDKFSKAVASEQTSSIAAVDDFFKEIGLKL